MTWRVLGPIDIAVDSSTLPIQRPQQRAVLGYLLLSANLVVSTEQLVEAMWGGAPTPTARTQLQVCVSQIRRTLREGRAGDRLSTESGGYRLIVDDGELDLAVFGRYVTRATAEPDAAEAADLLRTGLALWRGEPLAGAAGAYLEAATAALREQQLAAYEELAALELTLGRPESVVSTIQPLVSAHPLRERLVAQLILALAGCGQQAAALRRYDDTRRRLADDLGVQPAAEVTEAYLRVLRHGVPSSTRARPAAPTLSPKAAARPAQLPADIGTFTGRAAHLDALDGLLAGADTGVVIAAIDGMAGAGKTSLAVHWAHRVADRFGDGQLFVNLRGFGPAGSAMSPAEAIRGLLDALDVPPDLVPADPQAQVGLYRSTLAGKRMLVVLDNARDAEQVRPLLPGAPGCVALVTSRNRLVSLVAREGAHPLTIGPLAAGEAPELLARRLGARRVAVERDAVDHIVAACGGLPLALAIVAARAAVRPGPSLDELARQLTDSSGLDALHGGDPATDIRAILSWSYDAVSHAAATIFRLLGLHPGPDFTVTAAASLAGLPVDRAGPLLAELTEAHLLTQHRPGRYALHDLLRVYAAELAQHGDSTVERWEARHRVLDHYAHTATAASRLLDPHDDQVATASTRPGVTLVDIGSHREALEWFAAECPVLLATIAVAARDGYDEHTWQIAGALREYLVRRGHWRDLASAQHAALTAAQRSGDRPAQARTHRDLARAYAFLGRFRDARTHLQRALELFAALGDVAGQANTHLKLGGLFAQRGRDGDALRHATTALDQFEAIGHEDGYARALNNVGWYHAKLGDHRTTLTFCQRALTLHKRLGDRRGQADTHDSLGYAHHHLGDHDQAAAQYRYALTLYRDLGDWSNQVATLTRLGDVRLAAADRPGAREAWRQALDILDELRHRDAGEIRRKLEQL